MQILFLGSGAGETWPAAFCNDEPSQEARATGRVMPGASVLIDGRYLIDAPTGLSLNLGLLGVSVRFPFHIFITHSHQDHLDPQELLCKTRESISVYFTQAVAELLEHYARFNQFFNLDDRDNYQVNIVHPFEQVATDGGDTVLPIAASHDCGGGEQALNYILKIGGRTILYASDTGWYSDRTWQAVEANRFDVVILECTYMKTQAHDATGAMLSSHLNVEQFLKFIDRLRQANAIDDKTQVFATHFNLYEITQAGAAQLEAVGATMAHRGLVCEC